MPGFVVCSLRAPSTIKDCSHFSVIMDNVELYNSTFPLAPKVQLQEKLRMPLLPRASRTWHRQQEMRDREPVVVKFVTETGGILSKHI